ncbi:hypothetical protein VTN02DRAFT_1669 [Thermoascus thermophilus]
MPRYHDLPRRTSSDDSLTDTESGTETRYASTSSGLSEHGPSYTCDTSSISSSLAMDDAQSGLERGLSRFAHALVPSYLQHLVGGEKMGSMELHSIAALDGLRGWACLLVFNFHFLFTYTWTVAVGWGFDENNFGIHQLPFIHMLVSGHIMVAIFFVISGYVLSHKPLRMIRSKNWERAFTALASSTFRRGLRLYIPSIVGIFIVFLAVRMGVYDYSHRVIKAGLTITGTNEQHPPIMKTFTAQFWDWYHTVVKLMDPWHWELYYNNYNPHLWTIPVEFRSSMVLFVTILATSRLRTAVRMTLLSCIIYFCARWGRWDVVLFLCGMFLAEVDLINGIWDGPDLNEKPSNGGLLMRTWGRAVWICVFIFGLYVGSSPNTGVKFTPGYKWLANVTPKTYPEPHRFPHTIGAVTIVWSINNSRDIQKLFTNRLSQYLGRISFAFYIVHGPILHSLGYSIMPSIWEFTGKETNAQYCAGFLIGWLICLPVCLWAGDVFWRAVDIPSVKFARWLEGKVIVKANGDSSARW